MEPQEMTAEEIGQRRADLERIVGRIAIPLLDVGGRHVSGFRPDVYARALGL